MSNLAKSTSKSNVATTKEQQRKNAIKKKFLGVFKFKSSKCHGLEKSVLFNSSSADWTHLAAQKSKTTCSQSCSNTSLCRPVSPTHNAKLLSECDDGGVYKGPDM